MTMKLAKNAIDLGVVTADGERALAFYRDTLGLSVDGEIPVPGMGLIKRLPCGDSVIKLFILDRAPPLRTATGGFSRQTGFRYCTLEVENLDEVVGACRRDGHPIPVEIRDLRPGVRVAMVEDPDGNTIELMGP
jgi:catechol 2,3-dioxygenase-like lactoylglutathione lyase family enzyme